MTQILAHMGLG